MPKLKTKSGAKKRFRATASGKLRAQQCGKRHGMVKRSNRQIRGLRGTALLERSDQKMARRFLPYGGR